MTAYVALLRGINVGGNKKVEMAKLKQVFELLGYSNVVTYINSGNVIFQSDKAVSDATIESALEDQFGFEIRVVVRDAASIQQLLKAIPDAYANDANQKTDILFLWETYDKRSSVDLITANPTVDKLQYVAGAIIWHVDRADYAKSGMHAFIGTTLYKHMTARNVNTVRKIGELLAKQMRSV